ncbi:hypothetical protein WICMUC_001809 [Wickerhamomyces mucosus]|uniref:Uncharacterized protein n=1 Tax=Wickerhamomyces mucosus TaxID=1378264 RepID=A0A9P8PRZ1_9ASCO|nr:hypothetical protein WICMUC_001809 [Wickerhamomyces mucosus]
MTEESTYIPTDSHDALRVTKDLFAGTISGITQVLVGQPFDTVKVRLASDTSNKYKGAGDVVKKLISQEGPLAFYKGALTPLVGVGACVSTQFAANEYMKRVVFKNEKHLTSFQYYISGSVAGLANTFLAAPIEHIRSRLQTQISGKLGPLDVIKQVYAKGGIPLLMRGFIPAGVREAHGMGLYFLTFEWLVKREMINNNIERKEISSYKLCLFGALAGYSMWFTSYPIDFVKSRLQTDNLESPKYKGSLDVIKDVWKNQGPKGFFRGFLPTILRAGPANAATFCAFELTMRLIG